jgi:site-specific DNA-cytosine methylase
MKFIDLCAGLGGMRHGLQTAGWECVMSVEVDPSIAESHAAAFGDCVATSVDELWRVPLPAFDVVVAGFPCQPYSTSGHRSGSEHRSGSIAASILDLIRQSDPQVVIFENVEGLLHNKAGYSFAGILLDLSRLGYRVEWSVIDLAWLGVPQTRRRLFVVAHRAKLRGSPIPTGQLFSDAGPSVWSELLERHLQVVHTVESGDLEKVVEERKPGVGKRFPGPTPFSTFGVVDGGEYKTGTIRAASKLPIPPGLGAVVAPQFAAQDEIRSGRYYARGGPTKLTLRKDAFSHCVGTTLGGAPLFGAPLKSIAGAKDENALREFANWSRREEDAFVVRLSPSRTLDLFGPNVAALRKGLTSKPLSLVKQYEMVGNLVAPIVAETIANVVTQAGAA